MDKITKMYISLPITGYDLNERKEYAQQAGAIASLQYAQENPDCRCVQFLTPFEVCPNPNLAYAEYLGKDVTALMGCDVVAFAKGWQGSKGCRIEKYVADQMGIPTFEIGERKEEQP